MTTMLRKRILKLLNCQVFSYRYRNISFVVSFDHPLSPSDQSLHHVGLLALAIISVRGSKNSRKIEEDGVGIKNVTTQESLLEIP